MARGKLAWAGLAVLVCMAPADAQRPAGAAAEGRFVALHFSFADAGGYNLVLLDRETGSSYDCRAYDRGEQICRRATVVP